MSVPASNAAMGAGRAECAVRPFEESMRTAKPRRWRRICAVAAAAATLGGAVLVGSGASSVRSHIIAAGGAGSWRADHPNWEELAARPPAPKVPKGWEATWDGLAHRYYFYNQATKETSWDFPEKVEARVEPIYNKQEVYKKLTWGAQRPQAAAATASHHQDIKLQQEAGTDADPASSDDDGGPGSSSVNAVIAYWQQRGKHEMQQAKNAGFTAAVSDSYEEYDVAKGRAMHKTFKGAPGGGRGILAC